MPIRDLKPIITALNAANIPPDAQKKVLDQLRRKVRRFQDASPDEVRWTKMQEDLRAERRAFMCNRHNRPTYIRELCDEYIDVMNHVLQRMLSAQMHGSPKQAEDRALKTNAERAAEGKRPLATCGKNWWTWVPPHVREELKLRFAQAYAESGQKGGNQVRPFVTTSARREAVKRNDLLTKMFARMRSQFETMPGSGKGHTPYRALLLCAVRMAERALTTRTVAYTKGALNPADDPLPVNWYALLEHAMRARVREAQENPDSVTLDGLAQFYEAPPARDAERYARADVDHAQATTGQEESDEVDTVSTPDNEGE